MNLLNIKNKKAVIAWSFYDFANQPFSTIIVTFIYSAFFVKGISHNEDQGTFLWSVGIAITYVFVSLSAPILGAISDNKGNRRSFFIFFSLACSLFSMLLFFPDVGDVYTALVLFVIANISFELATVFCNSYLPDISDEKNIGRISGYSWGLGFVGGLLALFICFICFDVSSIEDIKSINILVGIWFIIFSLPAFLVLKDDISKETVSNYNQNIFSAFSSIQQTFKNISSYKSIYRFLIARLFFNDGLITIFSLGGIYAVGTLNFTFDEVLILGIVLNFCAGIGAFVFGYTEDRIGVKKVLNLSLVILMLAIIIAFIAPETLYPKEWFWFSGILIGLMAGPNQSCSRSLMSRLTPNVKKNEFFGFYALTGKATAFLGPLLFGLVTIYFDQQLAILVVLFFLLIGFLLFNFLHINDSSIN